MNEYPPELWQHLLDLDYTLAWGPAGVRRLRMVCVELAKRIEAQPNCDAKPVSHLGQEVIEGRLTLDQAWERCWAYEGMWQVANLALVRDELLARTIRKHVAYSDPPMRLEWVLEVVRCIVGNPFRPVAFDPRWRTETAGALASGIYAERAFDRLPILADALEEAGCDHPDVLAHCRGPGPHARGCWVVDGLLGK